MSKTARDLSLSVLALVCVLGDYALVATGHDVPPLLETITTVALGAVAGATVPRPAAAAVTSASKGE